ncbi:hypothetical protein D1872_348450 [compost metagenome]
MGWNVNLIGEQITESVLLNLQITLQMSYFLTQRNLLLILNADTKHIAKSGHHLAYFAALPTQR